MSVPRGADVRTLARAAVASCCDQVRLNAPGAKQGEDPAFAHQLRVGARRLRVALKLFRSLLEPTERASLEGELKWVFSLVGAQRELDVLLRDTLVPLLSDHETPALRALCQSAEGERARRHDRVRRALSSKRFARLLRALDALQTTLAERDGPHKSARKWSRKRLERRRDKTLALQAAVLSGDPRLRHQLRKEFKKLRYSSQLASALFKPKRVKRYLAAVEDVQEVLGALNDVAAGRAELRMLASGRQIETGTALAECEARFARVEAEQLAKLEPLLAQLACSKPFWRSAG